MERACGLVLLEVRAHAGNKKRARKNKVMSITLSYLARVSW